jgi:hypothetical protein
MSYLQLRDRLRRRAERYQTISDRDASFDESMQVTSNDHHTLRVRKINRDDDIVEIPAHWRQLSRIPTGNVLKTISIV